MTFGSKLLTILTFGFGWKGKSKYRIVKLTTYSGNVTYNVEERKVSYGVNLDFEFWSLLANFDTRSQADAYLQKVINSKIKTKEVVYEFSSRH